MKASAPQGHRGPASPAIDEASGTGRRPTLAGMVIAVGGAVAAAVGAWQGELLNVLGVLGLTLFVAGLVDGTGMRYRGAGTALLLVFASAKVIDDAPQAFKKGWAYGALLALYGLYVVVRQNLGGRSSA